MIKKTGLLMGALLASALSQGAPTIVDDVHGYTLTAEGLRRFDALAFESGKVLDTGDAKSLRARYADARVIDGAGATLLPGLIDAHGHVLALGTRAATSTSRAPARSPRRSSASAPTPRRISIAPGSRAAAGTRLLEPRPLPDQRGTRWCGGRPAGHAVSHRRARLWLNSRPSRGGDLPGHADLAGGRIVRVRGATRPACSSITRMGLAESKVRSRCRPMRSGAARSRRDRAA